MYQTEKLVCHHCKKRITYLNYSYEVICCQECHNSEIEEVESKKVQS